MARPVTLTPTTAFGTALRAARLAAGHSQRQLAALSGIGHARINKLESGRESDTPREPTILALAGAMECDPTPLLIAARRVPQSMQDAILDDPAWAAYLGRYAAAGIARGPDNAEGRPRPGAPLVPCDRPVD